MSHPLSTADVVQLACLTRGGAVESVHLGALAVVDADGELIASLGDPEALIYPRSTLKPFQALASLRAGADLTGDRLALACASHVGSQRHQDLAAAMLNDAGLSEEDLRCPTAYPEHKPTLNARIRAGQGANRLAFNCSGKHAAFLAACVAAGWDTASYLDPQHPLQADALAIMADFAGAPLATVSIDGCGAPVPQMPLVGLARAVSRLLREAREGSDALAARIAPAMLAHPWAVHGEGAENTVVMEELGVLTKLGAEGVLIMGAPDGTSLALKMLDGNGRANTAVGLSALVALGVLPPDDVVPVLERVVRPVLGGSEPVGAVEVDAAVHSLARA